MASQPPPPMNTGMGSNGGGGKSKAKPVIKWTLQASHTEHEQHKLRMHDLLTRPAMIHELQDKEDPHIIRSKIVLSGLRSTEKERHWQVELSRHKSSLQEMRDKVPVPALGDAPAENPFSLRRFKVAAEIETANERMLRNLRSVRPTVATARQCREDAERCRRARRHFQRYPTPQGPPTVPQDDDVFDAIDREHEAEEEERRQRMMAPMFDKRKPHPPAAGAQPPQQQQQHAVTAPRGGASLSYEEKLDRRERGWNSTTQVVHAHPRSTKSVGASNPMQPLSLPTPLRGADADRSPSRSSSASSSSSSSNDDGGRADRGELSVRSADGSPRRRSNSPKAGAAASARKQPRPPAKRDAAAASPSARRPNNRVSLLGALRCNPVVTDMRRKQEETLRRQTERDLRTAEGVEEQHRAVVADAEIIERRILLDDAAQQVREIRRRELGSDPDEEAAEEAERARAAAELEAQERERAAAAAAAESAEDKKRREARAQALRAEFDRRMDQLDAVELADRNELMRGEVAARGELAAKYAERRRLAALAAPCRVVQFFVRNRAPVNLVRKLVLFNMRRRLRALAAFLNAAASSRHVVLVAAARRQDSEQQAAKAADARLKLERKEATVRGAVEGEERAKARAMRDEFDAECGEIEALQLAVERPRREDIARPLSTDAITAALEARQREAAEPAAGATFLTQHQDDDNDGNVPLAADVPPVSAQPTPPRGAPVAGTDGITPARDDRSLDVTPMPAHLAVRPSSASTTASFQLAPVAAGHHAGAAAAAVSISPTSTQEHRQGEAAGAADRPVSAGAWSVAESFQIAGDGRSAGALSITPSPQHQQPALVGRSENEDEEL